MQNSPFPLRDFFRRLQTAHGIAGDAGVLDVLRRDNNVQMLMGILAVASEMEPTPEWQGLRMRMWSAAQAGGAAIADTAKAIANENAARYEDK